VPQISLLPFFIIPHSSFRPPPPRPAFILPPCFSRLPAPGTHLSRDLRPANWVCSPVFSAPVFSSPVLISPVFCSPRLYLFAPRPASLRPPPGFSAPPTLSTQMEKPCLHKVYIFRGALLETSCFFADTILISVDGGLSLHDSTMNNYAVVMRLTYCAMDD
jgi:hypothetical protein